LPSSDKLTRRGQRVSKPQRAAGMNPEVSALIRQISALKSRVEALDAEMQHLSDDIGEWETSIACLMTAERELAEHAGCE
jgi:prefoldin subunit 5